MPNVDEAPVLYFELIVLIQVYLSSAYLYL